LADSFDLICCSHPSLQTWHWQNQPGASS